MTLPTNPNGHFGLKIFLSIVMNFMNSHESIKVIIPQFPKTNGPIAIKNSPQGVFKNKNY
jgi:pyoverdine/dityrosine biosynthesis protein Dit1